MNYWKQVVVVCILIVVLVGVVAGVYAFNNAAERRANTAIANAKNETELQAVIKEYPKQKAIWPAYIRLGGIYVGKKDYASAYRAYQELLQKNIPEEMRREVEMNSSYLLELQGKKKEAVAAFAKIGGDGFYTEAMKCEGNYNAGRISFQIGDKTQAKTYLNMTANRIQKGAFDPGAEFWKRQAQLMLQRLDAPAADVKKAVAPAKTINSVKK